MDLLARYIGIPMTKIEKEHQQSIIRAELVPTTPGANRVPILTNNNHSTICSIQ